MKITRIELRLVFFACAAALSGLLMLGGCKENSKPATPSQITLRQNENRRDKSAVLVETIATGLNNLTREVVLELAPPRPILDGSTSVDGKEVLATCNVTPAVPDGPYNFLHVPAGNANFSKHRVRAGDIARYFVTTDQETQELGISQQTYLELTVRRLDANDPQNALIVEGGLRFPVLTPERLEIWRFSDKRMNEIRLQLTRYVQRGKPALGWEPSPDETALLQLVDRLNQWLRTLPDSGDSWQIDPLLAELPQYVQESNSLPEFLQLESFELGSFQPFEGRELQQAIWLRDIAVWAKGSALSDIDVASALFDWTVRNIQLDAEDTADAIYQPWQVLMYGHGTAEQRAWVFAELCRQQQLDVVMLAVGAEGESRWWLPALLSEGQLYLFDARLGLPILGKEPGQVATLADVVADPTILESLTIDEDQTYPVAAEDLAHVEAWLVASPLQLTRRAKLLQQVLEGEDFVVLAADNERIRKNLSDAAQTAATKLWPLPWDSVLEELEIGSAERAVAAQRFLVFAQLPRLWKARVLHFQGTKEVPFEQRNDPLAQPEHGHIEATRLYHDRRVRLPDDVLEQLDPARRKTYSTAKSDASYWLGLLSYDRGNYEVAVDWLKRRTLEATPDGPWTAGARYNLARTYEALGKLPESIELLEADDSPQRHGNLLRARQLGEQLEAETPAE